MHFELPDVLPKVNYDSAMKKNNHSEEVNKGWRTGFLKAYIAYGIV